MKTIDGKARTIREILSQDLLFLFKAPIRDLCGLDRSPAHEPCRRPRMAIEWLGNAPYSRLACRQVGPAPWSRSLAIAWNGLGRPG